MSEKKSSFSVNFDDYGFYEINDLQLTDLVSAGHLETTTADGNSCCNNVGCCNDNCPYNEICVVVGEYTVAAPRIPDRNAVCPPMPNAQCGCPNANCKG